MFLGALAESQTRSVPATAVHAVPADARTSTPDSTGIEDPEKAAGPPQQKAGERTKLNLLGQTDTGSGESRRNENVQFNLIDNNALKEMKGRLGTTATILTDFRPDQSYFAGEYGDRPPASIHLSLFKITNGIHGNIFETHNNSIFSARSFFQAGGVRPAHSNDYGFGIGLPLWRGANLSM